MQYSNERKAGKDSDSLRSLLPANCNVVREGEEFQIPASELVLGGVVRLLIGTRVPADMKVIDTKDLKLDFSSLTGVHHEQCFCLQNSTFFGYSIQKRFLMEQK